MASKFAESVCACETCQDMCMRRPCWPSPEEAQALINNGYGARLMFDYWVGGGFDGGDIHLLSPAIVGCEGGRAPFFPEGKCTFLTKDNLCELHSLGLKPIEGRVASCKGTTYNLHGDVAELWNNSESRSVVERWEAMLPLDTKDGCEQQLTAAL